MKKFIIPILSLTLGLSFTGFSQVKIQGTITDPAPGGNKVAVYGKNNSATDLSNVLFGNITLTFSIVDQTLTGGTNPTEAQIVKASKIPSLDILPVDGNNPYIQNGRAYYSYNMTNISSATLPNDGSTWLAGSVSNQIAEFTFPTNTFFPDMRLEDLSPDGGPNAFMFWYVQVNGAGAITDDTEKFFGTVIIPPTNGGSAAPSFVPLQPFSVVPVKFLGFTAIRSNNNAILNWQVENEDINTAKYEVEISTGGVSFERIASINPLNNGRSSNVYSFTKENISALRNAGVIYFRIKQIDRDGKFVYTQIRSIRLDGKSFSAAAFPNPLKDLTKLTIDLAQDETISIQVTDVLGKQLSNVQLQGVKGPNFRDINLGKYSNGTYMIKVQAGTEVKTLSVVKTN
jgi:hypothetical protein